MSDRPTPKGSKPLILLVEDDDRLSRLRALLLEQRGLEVSVSGSLDEALTALGEAPEFDAVLTDIKLSNRVGDKGGIELANVIRDRLGDIPVVGYSVFYTDDVLAEAGPVFDRYLAKGLMSVDGVEDALDDISIFMGKEIGGQN